MKFTHSIKKLFQRIFKSFFRIGVLEIEDDTDLDAYRRKFDNDEDYCLVDFSNTGKVVSITDKTNAMKIKDMKSYMHALPVEIILNIFKHLKHASDVSAASRVCKLWNRVISSYRGQLAKKAGNCLFLYYDNDKLEQVFLSTSASELPKDLAKIGRAFCFKSALVNLENLPSSIEKMDELYFGNLEARRMQIMIKSGTACDEYVFLHMVDTLASNSFVRSVEIIVEEPASLVATFDNYASFRDFSKIVTRKMESPTLRGN